MPLPKERIYTIDDIYALPDGERAELIDGQIYMMAPPNTRHQVIVGELYATIRNYIKSKSGSCKPYVSPFAVFLNEDNKNYVEPDLTVVCSPDKVDEKGCHGAPDWVIEVVSPATQSKDYGIKLFKYRMAGATYCAAHHLRPQLNPFEFIHDIRTDGILTAFSQLFAGGYVQRRRRLCGHAADPEPSGGTTWLADDAGVY